MSRFVNLEFGGESEDQWRQENAAVKDEGYYLAQARAAFEAADFELALRAFCKVLEYNPQNASAWAGQVRMLIELGEYEEALVWADKALELYPEHPDLLASKSVASSRTGDLEKAMAYTDNALSQRGATAYATRCQP